MNAGKLWFGICLMLPLMIANPIECQDEAKPKVSIFYETYNDVVRDFFVQQFRPLYQNISYDDLDIRLFPFGTTDVQTVTTNNETEHIYSCRHGDQQCLANKYHACVLDQTGSLNSSLSSETGDFWGCFFKNRPAKTDPSELAEFCSQDMVDAWENLVVCAQTENKTIMEILRSETGKVGQDIQQDGLVIQLNDETSEEAKSNLLAEVCKLLNKEDEYCSPREKVKVGVYYESMNAVVANYFQQQLTPYYHVLEDIIDLELVPFGNATVIDETRMEIECPQGDQQCFNNKFQALMILKYVTNSHQFPTLLGGINQALNFIQCLYKSNFGDQYSIAEQCDNQLLLGQDYMEFLAEIKLNGEKITEVLEDFYQKTKQQQPLANIPLITINGKASPNAFNDLVQEICKNYNHPIKPAICTKISATILYEASHHPSRTFFLEHVKPTFQNLYNLIDFNFKPAGRTKFIMVNDSHREFDCPGGPKQCQMMMIQACVLDDLYNDGSNYTDHNRQTVFDFIWCTFKNIRSIEEPLDLARYCSQDYLDNFLMFEDIERCLMEDAKQLFAELIEETQSTLTGNKTNQFPVVVFNLGQNNSEIILEDLADFYLVVCEHYDDYHKPDYCLSGEPNKVLVQVHYDSDNELAKHFFLTQLDPWYPFIEEITDLRLYPVANTEQAIDQNGVCKSSDDKVCIGNALNSYLIDLLENHDDEDTIDGRLRVLKFLSCFFSHQQWKTDVEAAGEQCAQQELINQNWSEIWSSINGTKYKQALLDAAGQTKKLKETLGNVDEITIPYVRFDETAINQKQAIDDLLQTVCNKYSGDKPVECTAASVDVYYSPLEYKTRRFFIDELIPTFRHVRERIQLNLVPFGIPASNNATVESECDLDAMRCEANRIQACALVLYWNSNIQQNDAMWDPKNQTLSFLYCFYKYIDDDGGLEGAMAKCADQYLPLGSDELESCVKNANESNKYMNQMLQKTLAQPNPMKSSPWIVINGDPNDQAPNDLQQSVCQRFLGEPPFPCNSGRPSKVNVQIHYSAVCPDMYRFVVGNLAPNYRDMEEIVNVELIPFGKSTVKLDADGNVTAMDCPRESECRGTLIHACVVDQMTNNDDHDMDGPLQVVKFLDCYFKSNQYPQSIVEAAEQCAEAIFHTDVWRSIMECARGPKGKQLLKQNSETVSKLLPHLTYIPWFVVNGRHSYTMEEHFVRTVCDAYEGTEKPVECYEKKAEESRPMVQVFYEPGDQKSRYFFLKQFNESLSHLNELVRIQMIPIGRPGIQPKITLDDDQTIPVDCVGDADCAQTIQQACLMREHVQDQSKLIDFIACNFRENSNVMANITETCVKQVFNGSDDVWSSIEDCAAKNGQTYLNENQKMVHELRPRLTHVPWILINDEHDVRAEMNMADIVCSQFYGNDKPDGCRPEQKTIRIYYETDNGKVTEFFRTQISDQREYLDEWANFQLYSFGSTKVTGDSEFQCTNGEQQCLANQIHACVLYLDYFDLPLMNPTRIKTMNFVNCSLDSSKTTEEANQKCYEQNFTPQSWIDIENCYKHDEGKTIFQWMANETIATNLTSVPWITIDGQRSTESVKNLFEVLCDSYELVKAARCYLLPSQALNVAVYFSSNQKGMQFLREQLLPFYSWAVPTTRNQKNQIGNYLDGMEEIENQNKLQSLLQVQLIPWGDTVYNDDETFQCSSETECFLNKLMACADYYHRAEPKARLHLIEFALCMADNQDLSQMNQTMAAQVANACANEVWLVDPYEQLDVCVRSNLTDWIFLEMKTKTESVQPPLKQFPSVTIDSVPNEEAGNNLMKVVCQSYQGIESNVPQQCEEYRKPEPPGPDSGSSAIHPSMIIFTISFMLLKFLL